LIVDGLWNLIEANRAAALLWDGVDRELLEPPINSHHSRASAWAPAKY
jgi:hypothetical protein